MVLFPEPAGPSIATHIFFLSDKSGLSFFAFFIYTCFTSFCLIAILAVISTRIHISRLPSTNISCTHISPASHIPISLAATAGYTFVMSFVAVKNTEFIEFMLILFFLIISFKRSFELYNMFSLVFSSTVIAPLIQQILIFIIPFSIIYYFRLNNQLKTLFVN